MRLYIGIVKTTVALLLSVTLLAVTAYAIPLPTTPPDEVDSTPVSHEAEPEGFRDVERVQELSTPMPREEHPLKPINKTPPPPDTTAEGAGIDTASILLIGAVIWYAVTLVGIAGGRRGASRRKRRQE